MSSFAPLAVPTSTLASPRTRWIGVEVSSAGVGLHYGARAHGGVLDGWLVDETDADQVPRLVVAGLAARAVPLMMSDHDATAAMAAAAVGLVTR